MNVQKLTNVVDFKVDRKSFNDAKKSIEQLKKYSESVKVRQAPAKKFNDSQKKAERELARVKAQNARKQLTDQKAVERAQKAADREALAGARRTEQADLKRRSALLQLNGIVGRTADEENKVSREIHRQARELEHGRQSVARTNLEIREQITLLRRAAAQRRKAEGGGAGAGGAGGGHGFAGGVAGGAARDFVKKGSLSEGLLGGLGAAGVGALGVGAVGLGLSKAIDTVRDTTEANREVINTAKSLGINANSLLALTQAQKAAGFIDANNEKSGDQIKDTREKIGDFVNNATLNKQGEWSGGGAVGDIANQFGWDKDTIASFSKNPLDFIQATVNAGQQKGLSDAQTANLIESLGDQLTYLLPALKNNGQGLVDVIKQMTYAGANLTDETANNTAKATQFSAVLDQASQGLSNEFSNGVLDAVGSSDQLKEALHDLLPAAKWMGQQVGDFITQLGSLVKSIRETKESLSNLFHRNEVTPEQRKDVSNALSFKPAPVNPNTGIAGADPAAVANASASGDALWNWIKGFSSRSQEAAQNTSNMFAPILGEKPNQLDSSAQQMINAFSPKGAMSQPVGYQKPQPVIVNIPDIIVNANTGVNDSEFSRAINTNVTAIFDQGMKRTTQALQSSVSGW
ncbi:MULTISPECIES: hypothetical protein [unclassified Pantoea]|uniref:hypothetical protein n=1 Tax=unclassified Pantoea TaxID=2630326 RepID=UPI0023DC606E|nr:MULTISPECIES: hypothetical protein [unclassified Pantoea]MDF2043254.1 hypothetical protein [Pantoea sp. Cr_R14]MDF2072307.1 hypothetical protein [Pantoea sp. Cr_R13]MDF2080556.1 hypothetical protein [Pantoea sp. Cr_R21]